MSCGSIDYFLKYICTVVFDVGTPLRLVLSMSDDGRFQSRQIFIIICYIILSQFFSLIIHILILLCRKESHSSEIRSLFIDTEFYKKSLRILKV